MYKDKQNHSNVPVTIKPSSKYLESFYEHFNNILIYSCQQNVIDYIQSYFYPFRLKKSHRRKQSVSQKQQKSLENKIILQLQKSKPQVFNQFLKFNTLDFYQITQSWNIHNFKSPEFLKLLKTKETLDISPKILKSISHIKFCSIKQLNLNQMFITSIQCMTWMDIPTLRSINLKENQICNLKAFNKCKLKYMKVILLDRNPFLSFHLQNLSRCQLGYSLVSSQKPIQAIQEHHQTIQKNQTHKQNKNSQLSVLLLFEKPQIIRRKLDSIRQLIKIKVQNIQYLINKQNSGLLNDVEYDVLHRRFSFNTSSNYFLHMAYKWNQRQHQIQDM